MNFENKLIPGLFVKRYKRFFADVSVNNKIITAEGIIEGKISDRPKGKNGFGYDPIFIPKGTKKTFGQMSKKKKMLMDHRFLFYFYSPFESPH